MAEVIPIKKSPLMEDAVKCDQWATGHMLIAWDDGNYQVYMNHGPVPGFCLGAFLQQIVDELE